MKKPMSMRKFTLTELLLTVGCAAVFAAVLLPTLRAASTRAESSVCLDRLRLCGRANLLYANDNDNILIQYRPWTKDYWTGTLYSEGYLQRKDSILCPDLVPPSFSWSCAFGVLKQQPNLWPNIGTAEPCWSIMLNKVKDPAGMPYLGDSAEPANGRLQQIAFVEPFSAGRTWHLRHNGAANIWYPDGRAAAESRELGNIFGKFLRNNAVYGAYDSRCLVWMADGKISGNLR